MNFKLSWDVTRDLVMQRDGFECMRCDTRENLTVHHIKSREKGGTDDVRNLVTLCKACHDIVELDPLKLKFKYKVDGKIRKLKAPRAYVLPPKRHRRFERDEVIKRAHQRHDVFILYKKSHPFSEHDQLLFERSSTYRREMRKMAAEWFQTTIRQSISELLILIIISLDIVIDR